MMLLNPQRSGQDKICSELYFKNFNVPRLAVFFVSMDLEMDGSEYLTPTILMVSTGN